MTYYVEFTFRQLNSIKAKREEGSTLNKAITLEKKHMKTTANTNDLGYTVGFPST